MLNVVAIMGRLVADPELRTTQSGTNVCSFRIACDRNFARQGEQRQADFIDIVAWRQQAEFVSKYFQKGSLIAIEGSLQTRQYQDKNGNNRTAVEVVANNVNFAGPKSNGRAAGRRIITICCGRICGTMRKAGQFQQRVTAKLCSNCINLRLSRVILILCLKRLERR